MMKMSLKYLALLALPAMSLLQPNAASAWTQHIDCEGGTVGAQVAQGTSNSFTNSFTGTTYSKTQVGSGAESCQMSIPQGSDGWDIWGGIYMFPAHAAAGSQVWYRVSVFVPAGFNYTGQPLLKFMRVHTASPSSSNQGYLDLYINPPTGTVWDTSLNKDVSAPYQFYYEGHPITHTFGVRPTNDIAFGKWETYEVNYHLDTTSKNQGGTGEILIWKNNQLLADLTDQITLADASTYAESIFLFTYWNGNAPATQSLFVDDIIVTTDTPANRDAAGHPYIGLAVPGGTSTGGTSTGSTAPVVPQPPANVTVQ